MAEGEGSSSSAGSIESHYIRRAQLEELKKISAGIQQILTQGKAAQKAEDRVREKETSQAWREKDKREKTEKSAQSKQIQRQQSGQRKQVESDITTAPKKKGMGKLAKFGVAAAAVTGVAKVGTKALDIATIQKNPLSTRMEKKEATRQSLIGEIPLIGKSIANYMRMGDIKERTAEVGTKEALTRMYAQLGESGAVPLHEIKRMALEDIEPIKAAKLRRFETEAAMADLAGKSGEEISAMKNLINTNPNMYLLGEKFK